MTRLRTILHTGFGAALLISACQSGPRRVADVITDKAWTLMELGGQPVDTAAGHNPPTLLLASAGERATGNAGCNRMAGSYKLGPGSLEFGPMALTRMACPAMDLESRYTAAISAARQYRVETGHLQLIADGRVLARFAPAPAP